MGAHMSDDAKNRLQSALENIQEPFSGFIRAQTTSSWLLFLATGLALWWANSDYASVYDNLKHTFIGFYFGESRLQISLEHIINDGLMAIFFFLLGLEIKRDVLAGDLARPKTRRMLILCAVGGMVCPAVIYLLFNWSLDSEIGWGIPIATDTAFALGVLALVRKHVPASLLGFLVGLAIVDDVGAILVIAIFYAKNVSLFFLFGAFALVVLLGVGSYAGIREKFFYIILGVAAWWMMLKSGVHPTLAGVLVALTVPARPKVTSGQPLHSVKRAISSIETPETTTDVLGNRKDHERVQEVRDFAEQAGTPLRRWEDALDLPVSLVILPLFVLCNAGISFRLSSFVESLQHPVGLGVIGGLIVGKFIGISGACWLGLRFKLGCLPETVNFQHVVGISLIAGIGFTMSTFIATLGFEDQPEHLYSAKASILVASCVAAAMGLLYIRFIAARRPCD
jgi:NhaA family Na+:H+ antiporter